MGRANLIKNLCWVLCVFVVCGVCGVMLADAAMAEAPQPEPDAATSPTSTGDDWPLWSLIVILLAAGVFGGTLNWILHPPPEGLGIRAAMTIGMGAALLIPLFLNTISSTLLPNLLSGDANHGDVLVFAGFAILAAICYEAHFASAFLSL